MGGSFPTRPLGPPGKLRGLHSDSWPDSRGVHSVTSHAFGVTKPDGGDRGHPRAPRKTVVEILGRMWRRPPSGSTSTEVLGTQYRGGLGQVGEGARENFPLEVRLSVSLSRATFLPRALGQGMEEENNPPPL
jgi:hypothetical protein